MARMIKTDELEGSAIGGDEVAAFELAMCHASGSGELGVDLVQAHRWFNVAASLGYQPAREWRHEIAMEMSATEVAEAQKLARWTLGTLMQQAA